MGIGRIGMEGNGNRISSNGRKWEQQECRKGGTGESGNV